MNKKQLEEIRKRYEAPEDAGDFLLTAPQDIWDLLDHMDKLEAYIAMVKKMTFDGTDPIAEHEALFHPLWERNRIKQEICIREKKGVNHARQE